MRPGTTAQKRPQTRRTSVIAGAAVAALAVPLVIPIGHGTEADAAGRKVRFGVSAVSKEDIQRHESTLDRRMDVYRIYKKWDSTLFSSDMRWARDGGRIPILSIASQRNNGTIVPFEKVADAARGSALYEDMQDQAAQVKAFKGEVYLVYNHEPETSVGRKRGNATDFKAAFRKWVTVMRNEGVTNAHYTFVMSAYAYKRTDQYQADNYFPGASYVDAVGADGGNWYKCGQGTGEWRSFTNVFDDHRDWGKQYPNEELIIAEWGTVEDPANTSRKADWIKSIPGILDDAAWGQYTAMSQWTQEYYNDDTCEFGYHTSTRSTSGMRTAGLDDLFATF